MKRFLSLVANVGGFSFATAIVSVLLVVAVTSAQQNDSDPAQSDSVSVTSDSVVSDNSDSDAGANPGSAEERLDMIEFRLDVLDELLVGLVRDDLGAGLREVVAVAHVVPVAVGREHPADPGGPGEGHEQVVLVGRVDDDGLAAAPVADEEHVVVEGPDHELVHPDRGGLEVGRSPGRGGRCKRSSQ